MVPLRNSLLICLLLCGAAQGTVVEGTNILWFPPDPNGLPYYEAQTYQLAGPGFNGTYFNYSAANHGSLTYELTTLGSLQTNWFLVNAGDEFDATTIAAGQFTPLYGAPFGGPVAVNFPDFYLGVELFNPIDPAFGPPAYGWIHLQKAFPGLLVTDDNAISYNSSGIIVGTETEVVPEPSSFILLLLASASLLWRYRHADCARART